MLARVLGILGFVVILFGAGAVLSWRAGYLNGVSMQSRVAPEETAFEGHLIVQLHAQIDNPGEAARSHDCAFSATIANQSRYHLLAGHVLLHARMIDLPEIASRHSADVPLWTVAIPQEASSCTAKARWFQRIARDAKATTCAMQGVPQDTCRRLVRVAGDFDYPRLQADDFEAGNAQSAAAAALRKGNLAAGTVVSIPPNSFFKLGFDRKDAQKSDAARALVSADTPFSPDNAADINRLVYWGYSAAMEGPLTVLAAHQDKERVADWYKVSLWANTQESGRFEVIAWVSRDDLEKAHAETSRPSN